MASPTSPTVASRTANDLNPNKRKSPPEPSASGRPRPKTEFSQGGDLILQSIDGSRFSVHSIILSVASPVFANMFEVASRGSGEVVELAETGEMIDLMLRFIYPKESPTISSFDMLDKAMHVANKYELEGMHRQLCRELGTPSSPVSCYKDALGAFAFATAHGLNEEIKLAQSLAQKAYQLNTVEDLLKLSATAPASIPWILLIGIPSVKSKIISTLLFSFHEEPMKLVSCTFLCLNCVEHQTKTRYAAPEWQARWAHGLLAELTRRPMDDWEQLFQFEFLSEAVFRRGGSPNYSYECGCTCVRRCETKYRISFTQWSSKVHQCLITRLADLERLETLIS
ncbi:hypothetical protein FRC11_011446 [Ceratobasidium sp. 423]|nr:hypothetical protein FRC11_011446 [Ceratobasidium sp. 423]